MFLRPRGQNKSNPFFAAVTVVSADSQALFAPANRDTSSKAPRCIRHRRRIGAFHVREEKYLSGYQCASFASARSTPQTSKMCLHIFD